MCMRVCMDLFLCLCVCMCLRLRFYIDVIIFACICGRDRVCGCTVVLMFESVYVSESCLYMSVVL